MKIRKGITLGLITAMLMILVGGPVLALDEPDSAPDVSNIHINRYLIEEGDILIYGDYSIPYTTPPTMGADEVYSFRLMDGEDEIAIALPYPMLDNGYNNGVFSIYLSADVSGNITWGESYTIRISQNPTHFSSPNSWDYEIPTSAYTSLTTQKDNQVQLSINILAAARRMEEYYTDYTFLEDSAGGTVLSSPTGETYFRGAIYGIQVMAPDLFLVQILEFDTSDRVWTTAQADTYAGRFDTTWVETDVEATATQFSIGSQMLMAVIFIVPLCIGAIIVSMRKYDKPEPGLVASAVFIMTGFIMGWMPAAIFATTYQLAGIYIAYLWFYARSS